MSKSQTIVAGAAAFLGLGLMSVQAWAGEVKGKVTAVGMRSAENIAVYIDSVPGKTFNAPPEHVSMDQTHLSFAPHVLVVQQGTTVEFKNDDNVGHNVYWPAIHHDKKLAHNMGTWSH